MIITVWKWKDPHLVKQTLLSTPTTPAQFITTAIPQYLTIENNITKGHKVQQPKDAGISEELGTKTESSQASTSMLTPRSVELENIHDPQVTDVSNDQWKGEVSEFERLSHGDSSDGEQSSSGSESSNRSSPALPTFAANWN